MEAPAGSVSVRPLLALSTKNKTVTTGVNHQDSDFWIWSHMCEDFIFNLDLWQPFLGCYSSKYEFYS